MSVKGLLHRAESIILQKVNIGTKYKHKLGKEPGTFLVSR